MLTLDEEQQAAVDRMLAEPTQACLNASDTGVGKTLMAVELAKNLGAKKILVVGPANPGVRASWERTFSIQGTDLPFTNLTSATRKKFNPEDPEQGIWYVSKEFMRLHDTLTRSQADKEPAETDIPWHKTEFDLVIADEAHFATNPKAKTTRVLWRLKKAKYRLALSATPQGSNFAGFWALCRFLWYDYPLPGSDENTPRHLRFVIDPSYHRWVANWCEIEKVYTGRKDHLGNPLAVDNVVGPRGGDPQAFIKSVPCYVSLKAIRQPTHTRRIHIDLSDEQRRIHDELLDQALAWLNENQVLAIDYPIVLKQRLRQVTLATPRIDDEGTVQFDSRGPSAKADAIVKIRRLHPGQRILVYTTSEKFTRVLRDRLGEDCHLWTGPITKRKRMENWDAFSRTEDGLFVATYGAVAEGTDGLQHLSHIEIWADEPYSTVQIEQVSGRLNRRGQKNDIIRYKLLANDSADIEDFERMVGRVAQRRSEL